MKKFLMMVLMSLSMLFVDGLCNEAHAQVQYYQTQSYAFARIYQGRYVWGDWERSDMVLTIDLGRDLITVYSPQIQIYRIVDVYNNGNPYRDKDGAQNVKFYAIDADNDRCEVRLRVERNGNSQIYFDFSNVAWVYVVTRTN